MAVGSELPPGRSPGDGPARKARLRLSGKRQVAGLALVAVVGLALLGWACRPPDPLARPGRRRHRGAEGVADHRARRTAHAVHRGHRPRDRPLRRAAGRGARHVQAQAGRQRHRHAAAGRAPRLGRGQVAMAVDGRPVFVLPGASRCTATSFPATTGPTCCSSSGPWRPSASRPAAVDGRYDSATEGAVSSFYLRRGWDPFGPTDTQLDQLHTAEAAAAAARDAHLQALNALDQAQRARRRPTSRRRASTRSPRATRSTRRASRSAPRRTRSARRPCSRPAPRRPRTPRRRRPARPALADADVAAKRTALNLAVNAVQLARYKADELALRRPAVRAHGRGARGAARREDAVAQARAELDAVAGDRARRRGPRARAPSARPRDDLVQAQRDVRIAREELRPRPGRARTARTQAVLARSAAAPAAAPHRRRAPWWRSRGPPPAEAARTRAEVARLARQGGVQVPANEILFFPTLPLRVDAVKAKRGSQVSGPRHDA